jgi:hypothetical protein
MFFLTARPPIKLTNQQRSLYNANVINGGCKLVQELACSPDEVQGLCMASTVDKGPRPCNDSFPCCYRRPGEQRRHWHGSAP